MHYPYVESDAQTWDFTAVYYADAGAAADAPGMGSDHRADVGSDRLTYAAVLRDISGLGAHADETVDAILYWIALEVTREMRVSTTRKPLDDAARLWGSSVDAAFSARLVERAESLLRGAALVGALRAIAWHLSFHSVDRYRSEVVARAREKARSAGLVSGQAALVADDAHAHLRAAERVRPGHDDLRSLLAWRGTLLLGASFAMALLEPWDPFLRTRLNKERFEHAQVLEEIAVADPSVRSAFEACVVNLESSHTEADKAFEAHLEERGYTDDIPAFFRSRHLATSALLPEQLPADVRQFIDLEPGIGRVL